MTRNEEIMTILQEECAELIQAISKVKRFGLSDNIGQINQEMCDVWCLLELMREFHVTTMKYEDLLEGIFQKRQKLKNFSKIFEENS